MRIRHLFGLEWLFVFVALCLARSVPGQAQEETSLFRLSNRALDLYLRSQVTAEPDAAKRLVRVATGFVGQPHQPAILGEGSYDAADPKPLYALDRSDAVSFVEQSLAMAVSRDFRGFFLTLQRIRYREGRISTAGRNHNLLADWGRNNTWLLEDVTPQLGNAMAWVPLHQIVRKRSMLAEKFGIQTDFPDEKLIESFVPRVYLRQALAELRPGDVVMLITGNDRQQFCEDMGILLEQPKPLNRPLAANHPHERGQPSDHTWYDVAYNAYTSVDLGIVAGGPALCIRDPGYTNGVYCVVPAPVQFPGTYRFSARMRVVEAPEHSSGIMTYEMGVAVNGQHRGPGNSRLSAFDQARDAQAVVSYRGLTQGFDEQPEPQELVTQPLALRPGDRLLIAFSTDLSSGTFNQGSGQWGEGHVLVGDMKLIPAEPAGEAVPSGAASAPAGGSSDNPAVIELPLASTTNGALPALKLAKSQSPQVDVVDLSTLAWQRREILGCKFLRLRPDAAQRAAGEADRLATTVAVPVLTGP